MIMKSSFENEWRKLQELVLSRIERQFRWYIPHLHYGNLLLGEVLHRIGNLILDEEKKRYYFQLCSADNISTIYNAEKQLEQKIADELNGFSRVIIYGAGGIGKSVYDFISCYSNIELLGFAVTKGSNEDTARGCRINNIDSYYEYSQSKDVLLIIAGGPNINLEMKEHAKNLGFKHIIQIEQIIYGMTHFSANDGQFAFGNIS